MSPELCASIDGLLNVPDAARRSALFQFKQYPPEAKPRAIREYLERFALLRSVGARALDFSDLDFDTVADLAALVRRYDVDDLKRFAPPKRYALVACFLAEAQKTILDHIVEMRRDYMITMNCRARRATLQGRRDRRVWELALAFAVRDALRSGDLYLEESRHHVSFWNLVHSTERWERERDAAYVELALPPEAATALDRSTRS